MALTRKFLKALGIDEEKIEEIINAHVETLQPIKDERDELKTKADALDAVTKERDALKKAAEASDGDAYKVKYEELKTEFDAYKAEVTTKAEKDAKARLYRELAKKAGVNEKRIDAIMKVTNLDAVKLEKDGNALADADKLEASIKTEWADFLTTNETRGADAATPPANGSGQTDLGKLSMAEYIAARKKKS